jgi:MFS family permease
MTALQKPIQPKINRTILQLGIISFFGDISSEMLYPITPIFLTTVLGASMTSLGLIEGTAEAVASFLKIYSGVWSDRIRKRKPFIVVGYLFASLAKPMTGMASAWTHVLFARSFDRVGKGLRTAPRDALISESVSESQRGHAFGLHRIFDTLGAAFGPLIAIAYLTREPESLRTIYYWAFIPGLLSVLLATFIREPAKENTNLETAKIRFEMDWRWKNYPESFRSYLIAWTVFSIANSSDVFLLMKVRESGIGMTATILMYIFYNLLYALLSPYFGKQSDHRPRREVLFFGLMVFASVYLGFSFASEWWQFLILFGLYGVYMASTEGVGKALAVDLFDPDRKATAIGIIGMVTGLATILASTIGGLLWDYFGSVWTFWYAAIGALIAGWFIRVRS